MDLGFNTIKDLNKRVVNAEYAVRGTVPIRAAAIKEILTSGNKQNYQFKIFKNFNIFLFYYQLNLG